MHRGRQLDRAKGDASVPPRGLRLQSQKLPIGKPRDDISYGIR